jgi:short-subunit dehydrogenase
MGLGAALSHNAAARGLNVAMLARGEELLRQTADEVGSRHGVEVRAIPGDLADPGIGRVVAEATDDLEVGLLVYNATLAVYGRFLEAPIEEQLKTVAINCSAPLVLCQMFARKMAARQRGGIALVNSLAAVSGSVNFAAYNAGKAFEWILSETLWSELTDAGIDVTTLLVASMSSPSYLAYSESLDPAVLASARSYATSKDPLERFRARMFDPSSPDEVANALYDQLPDGPVCYSRPDDAEVGAATLALPRDQAVTVWRGMLDIPLREG